MKKSITILMLTLTLIFSGCRTGNKTDQGKIISVSILPQKYFTGQISGSDYKINVLIPPGASPASYEPSPRQLQDLSNSLMYLKIGKIAFEEAWIDKYQKNNPQIPFYDLSEGTEFIKSEEDHGDHRHEGADPHIWMSAKNALIICENIYHALVGEFPPDSALFRENYTDLKKRIMYIDSLYESNMDLLEGKEFLIYHPALGYLARDYGMHQHVLEFDGKEPPPSHIAKIIKEAREHNIEFIFVQKQFSMDNARSIAEEIDARIIAIDPLSEDWPGEMKNILNHLKK